MTFIEITGQPCSGKSSFISQEITNMKTYAAYKMSNLKKLFIFFYGLKYLGFQRSKTLYSWSAKESAPFFFQINIFRNAVSKFGIFQDLCRAKADFDKLKIVDEGLSHIPFLFLNTDTEQVVDFISDELRRVNVKFLKSPGSDVIRERLRNRGHKRLKFLSVDIFIKRNNEIENILLNLYPALSEELKVFEYVENI